MKISNQTYRVRDSKLKLTPSIAIVNRPDPKNCGLLGLNLREGKKIEKHMNFWPDNLRVDHFDRPIVAINLTTVE